MTEAGSKSVKLNNGVSIPSLGFGTFAGEIVPGEMYAAIIAALDAGYRHLDSAWFYKIESEVGRALKDWLDANPKYKREDIFITTKVWPHLMEPEDVKWSLETSLRDMGIDYVDAFLFHWPFAVEKTEEREVKKDKDGKYILNHERTSNLLPAWRAMESLQTSGKAKTIGVSNFTVAHLTNLLSSATIKPAINQIEIHPYFPNTALVDFCLANDVMPVAYSPLGSQNTKTDRSVLADPVLQEMAREKRCEVAQICIAWGLKRGYVVIPKSGNPARVRKNFEVVELSEEEIEKVGGVAKTLGNGDVGKRYVNPVGLFGFDIWAFWEKS
ncbi:hypothetical protein HYALB_00003501 [Hymenoscyphus albidus]|uniref:NADP-dependent oxidoreductase domain-containing protein n=1 Tax=Hymenoscyphus albidus TaxID=595503 RepID=A0A9N9Q268_9HELO|nr:hypothetical protein HYALB_00003501 [Hymenoscyphus albidus]